MKPNVNRLCTSGKKKRDKRNVKRGITNKEKKRKISGEMKRKTSENRGKTRNREESTAKTNYFILKIIKPNVKRVCTSGKMLRQINVKRRKTKNPQLKLAIQ